MNKNQMQTVINHHENKIKELNSKISLLTKSLNYISGFMLENAEVALFKELLPWGRESDILLETTPADCLKSIKIQTAIELAGIFHDGKWRSDMAMEICEEYAKSLGK